MTETTNTRKDFLAYVLVTAVEGGVNYWADIRNYKNSYTTNMSSILSASAEIKTDEPDDNDWKLLTIDVIENGIQNIQTGEIVLNPSILGSISYGNATNDAGSIDSDAADCIVQVALFGKIVYG